MPSRQIVRSEAWKSGLASETITRVPGQLEQNGQVLQIPHNICNNLVYIRFLYVENLRRNRQKRKKMIMVKKVYLSFLNVKNATSFISQKFN